jgi:hypothetical protein
LHDAQYGDEFPVRLGETVPSLHREVDDDVRDLKPGGEILPPTDAGDRRIDRLEIGLSSARPSAYGGWPWCVTAAFPTRLAASGVYVTM